MLKNIRSRFGGKRTKREELDGPYKRETRSIDVRMSHPTLGLQMNPVVTDGHSSRTASSMSTSISPVPLCNSPTSARDTLGQNPVRLVKTESMPAKARPNNNTAAGVVTNDQVLARVQKLAPDNIISEPRIPVKEIPYGGQDEIPKIDDRLAPAATQAPKISSSTITNIPNALRAAHASSTAPTSLSFDTMSRPLPSSSSPAASAPPRRATAPCITDMPPSAFRINTNGVVRLSPSIIIRPAPTPLLRLPKMPEPSSNPPRPPPKPQARLRSVPALSVDGTNELDREADHDNAALDDSDEDEEGEEVNGGSDEEGEDLTSGSIRSHLSPAATPTSRPGLPNIDTTPLDFLFPAIKSPVGRASSHAGQGEMTPTATTSFDYFSVKPVPASSAIPLVDDAKPKSSARLRPATSAGTSRPRIIPMPTPSISSRPVLYHHVSKSMINLVPPKQEVLPAKDLDKVTSDSKGKGKAPAGPNGHGPVPEYTEGPSLRRRRSMPIFNATSDPPPYPTFARRDAFVISPRDDEGKERLPDYTNSIHLTAIMPRKMEFTAPGVQAKDRKWRRALCELQGTVFRVYKCPPGVTGSGVIGEWWEKQVGVGDIAANGASTSAAKDVLTNGVREGTSKLGSDSQAFSSISIPSGSRRTHDRHPSQTQEPGSTLKSRRLAVALLHPVTRGGSSPAQLRPQARSQSDATSPTDETRPRRSLNIMRSTTRSSSQLHSLYTSSDAPATSSDPSPGGSQPPSASRSSFFPKPNGRSPTGSLMRPEVHYPDRSDLIRAYTLQNAESGLGNDYLKRKNVIRVRMEGEQFLLQAHDVPDVVEWIEVCPFV